MNCCPNCNNELDADGRFCNMCGTLVQQTPLSSSSPKRRIQPEIRHVHPTRKSQVNAVTPIPPAADIPQAAATIKSNETNIPRSEPAGFDASNITASGAASTQRTPNTIKPLGLPAKPRTTADFKPSQFQKPGIDGNQQPARQNEVNSVEPWPPSTSTAAQTPAAGLIRPVMLPARSLQNTPPAVQSVPISTVSTARKVLHPQSPLPAIPTTPALPEQRPGQELREISTDPDRLQAVDGSGWRNGANDGQDKPISSPESLAYTRKAAERWRSSWRDRQYAEAGPAEKVSKGQASVSPPLADKQNSFIRMRAIRIKQNEDADEKNFGFWVAIILMTCLIAGLGVYILSTYLHP